ncbi:hypothetical protein BKA67DRAFT_105917 [Truncatella angustata]|uniref:Secreted protein n=1 Tax=Truncatella angustata TaxID=152316 RepID=A0A9P8RLJ1_9PEZI|nr:uncharacterized protein BKA67DRAFT_105917 [Truncatella angustata]KAH6646498.1 hypothetical protein BKA67DRAFT_105917 [Truncatella angustata]
MGGLMEGRLWAGLLVLVSCRSPDQKGPWIRSLASHQIQEYSNAQYVSISLGATVKRHDDVIRVCRLPLPHASGLSWTTALVTAFPRHMAEFVGGTLVTRSWHRAPYPCPRFMTHAECSSPSPSPGSGEQPTLQTDSSKDSSTPCMQVSMYVVMYGSRRWSDGRDGEAAFQFPSVFCVSQSIRKS